ncbi:hypothetical protein MOQ_000325 [Trypanosoma cruzi marinkellei]|uniref:Uncharacterized protein n=1 Tax=Trypanosoma cruzi marinkellei TaxID=85056 RepID=K2MW18_TRYCR|nr:hypothetical protein MOQ_000325 [Trypanosoma cruzi marinkellei]
MSATVSPRSYWAALREQRNASHAPVTPSPSPPTGGAAATTPRSIPPCREFGRQSHGESVVIENSSILGMFNDPFDTTASELVQMNQAINGRGRSRSLVMDFIDECVLKGMPESLIVEHVMFMVHAMQEQINLTEALHARFHHDRLREYEVSELTNMLERQQVYYDQQQEYSNKNNNNKKRQEIEEVKLNLVQGTGRKGHATPRRFAPSFVGPSSTVANVRMKAVPTVSGTAVGSRAVGGRHGESASRLSTERHLRVAFTQTPTESSEQQRHGRAVSRATVTPAFQRFMRPTDASNRKERRKYSTILAESHAHPLQVRSDQPQSFTWTTRQHGKSHGLAIKKEVFAQRGRQRLVGGVGTTGGSQLTWSDGDDDDTNNTLSLSKCRGEDGSPGPRIEAQQKEEEATPSDVLISPMSIPHSETLGDGDGATAPRVYDVNRWNEKKKKEVLVDSGRQGIEDSLLTVPPPSVAAAAPLLSVHNPSFFPNPQLLAYIEQSRRKVREAERVLANSPGKDSGRGVQ